MRPQNGLLKTARGNEYHWISFGKGEEDLVIIPGLGDGLMTVRGKAWMGPLMFRKVADNYRVTVISRKNNLEIYADTRSMARDQAEAMEELGIHHAHIVGVSQGGMIAQHLAAANPQMVDRLILIATCPKSTRILEENLLRWFDMANRSDYVSLMTDINVKSHTEEYMGKIRMMTPLLHLMPKPKSYERFMIQAKACMSHDATGILDKIKAPTLIVGGEKDETLGPDASRELHAAIPGSKIFMYPEFGHALYEDAKDFFDRVTAFITLGTFIP